VYRGHHPFLSYANEYLDVRSGYIAESTVKVQRGIARRMDETLVMLAKLGKTSTSNPASITREDIGALLVWMRDQGYENSYKEKLLGVTEQVMDYAGNNVFLRLRMSGIELPKRTPKTLFALSEAEVRELITVAYSIKGWRGDVTRFMTSFYPFTGVRPSEMRRAQLQDLKIRTWEFYVRHPKGENKYADRRTISVLPPAREHVLNFLAARDARCKEVGLDPKNPEMPLVPVTQDTWKTVKGNFYSESKFREFKAELMEKARVDLDDPSLDFSLRTYRDTFCQMNIDRDPAVLSAVSKQMGHATSATTEKHYGRIKSQKANEILQNLWNEKKDLTP